MLTGQINMSKLCVDILELISLFLSYHVTLMVMLAREWLNATVSSNMLFFH